MAFIKHFPEKKYKEVLKEMGLFRYQIFDKDEKLPGEVFPIGLPFSAYNCIVGGTGSTSACYTFVDLKQQFTIPKGEQLFIARLLRYDHNQGRPHYNADDYLIFPTQQGNVFIMKRSNAPDHFVKITDLSQIKTIAEAYQLPDEKAGTIENYGNKGAKLHVQIKELKQEPEPFTNL